MKAKVDYAKRAQDKIESLRRLGELRDKGLLYEKMQAEHAALMALVDILQQVREAHLDGRQVDVDGILTGDVCTEAIANLAAVRGQ